MLWRKNDDAMKRVCTPQEPVISLHSALLESCEMPERVIVLAGGAQFPLAAMAGRGWKSSPAYLAPLRVTKRRQNCIIIYKNVFVRTWVLFWKDDK